MWVQQICPVGRRMGRFDAALKYSIAAHPADWGRLLGVPDGVLVEAVDTDLSTVSQSVDKLLRVGAQPESLIHVEFQGWSDPEFDERMLLYHCSIRRREKLPVHSVAFVLRPTAWSRENLGGIRHESVYPGCRLDFAYQVIKVWEQPPQIFLNAGLGVLPLAPLANVSEESLPAVVESMSERLREANRADAAELWTATHLLMGLKYETDLIELMLRKVRSIMQESVTYQAIRREGILIGSQNAILRQGTERFGEPEDSIRDRVHSITSPDALDDLLVRLLSVSSWDELLEPVDPAE